jgi:hypothetical protein
MNRATRIVRMIVIGIVAIPLFIFVGGEIVLHLWNWLLPPLFGWHMITFWQAVALLALCRILFGRIGGGPYRRGGFRRRMSERWERMTPEERERFRQEMRGRCGAFGSPAAEPKA